MTKKRSVKDVVLVENFVLVKVAMPSTETESGLVINKELAHELQGTITGNVLCVGPDVKNFALGDDILLPSHSNTPVVIEKDVYHVFRETSLFAKFK